MKKKIIFFIVILLIIIQLSLIVYLLLNFKLKKNENNKNTESTPTENKVATINTNGENAGIFVGTYNNFLLLSTIINKDKSNEEQAQELISAISDATGYKIEINSININSNTIKIDFSKNAAPFELENSYLNTGSEQYYISSDSIVAKTLFDSITKTLKSYFSTINEVYYSVDSENIELEDLKIDSTKPYKY